MQKVKLDKKRTLRIIKAALEEDIGPADVTTTNIVGKTESVKAAIIVKESCIICGVDMAEWLVNTLDCSVRFKPQINDGERISPGKEIIFLEGHAWAILSAERTMLNFLSFLSGIATRTRGFVEKCEKYGVRIYDTRKTLPLLRYLEKYAVTVGGGKNHRFGLWDQALVKDNHLKITGRAGQKDIVEQLKAKLMKNIKLEIEVDNLEQFKSVLAQGPDIIMLDNMSPEEVKQAVKLRNKAKSGKQTLLEVSGGIIIDSVELYARTGVDRISVGSLTDSVESVDMSLEIM